MNLDGVIFSNPFQKKSACSILRIRPLLEIGATVSRSIQISADLVSIPLIQYNQVFSKCKSWYTASTPRWLDEFIKKKKKINFKETLKKRRQCQLGTSLVFKSSCYELTTIEFLDHFGCKPTLGIKKKSMETKLTLLFQFHKSYNNSFSFWIWL